MLMTRLDEPTSDELLYHYCSAATLNAIATNKTLRFTDINMLNDATESRWAYSIFEEAATRLITRKEVPDTAPHIEKDFFDKVDEIVSPIQLIAHPFLACFSLEPDLLGQWRAYADDGRGFALGFHSSALKHEVPATFLRVLYDRELQVKEMMVGLAAIFLRLQEESDATRATFFEDCVLLATFMTAFKHPAFREENEVRAAHVVNIQRNGNLPKFVDPGGTRRGDEDVPGTPVQFQVRDNHLIAFTDISFSDAGEDNPLTRVVLGPRNHSAPGNLAPFLGGLGFTDISLRRSMAPYRG
jgi:hypothetical protein